MVISTYLNKDLFAARNILLETGCSLLLPYVAAKWLLPRDEEGVDVAHRIALLLLVVLAVGLYQFATGTDPYNWMRSIFPGHTRWTPQVRYGLVRIVGAYDHAILAGIVFAVGYRMTRMLEWSHSWPGDIPFAAISRVRFSKVCMMIASLMTISRGPWLGAAIGAVVVAICRARSRKRATAIALAAMLLISVPVYRFARSYAWINRQEATTIPQRDVAYRHELFDAYLQIVAIHPAWGWGLEGFPRVRQLDSIDNEYLLMALVYGLNATLCLIAILLWVSLRLLARTLYLDRNSIEGILSSTLLGVQIVFAISFATVWMGAQTGQLLFLFVGWSEASLLKSRLQ